MVEGGARVSRMFLDEGMADTLRLAVNPRLGSVAGAGQDSAAQRRPRASRTPARRSTAWR